jgi:Oligoribonuclease (3''->5'' exoribonuclease)
MQNPQNLIWIDLEMTGLNPDTDVIIEMATIVTDSDLNTLAEGPVIAIHHSDEILAGMDEWNTRQHGGSGLTQRVRDSRISMAEAEAKPSLSWKNGCRRASRRSVATVSARTVASFIRT